MVGAEALLCPAAGAGRAIDCSTGLVIARGFGGSGLRMTPSLTPMTTDWRPSSGTAGMSQPCMQHCN